MRKERVPSGIKPIDSLLNGGFEKDIVTMIYGGAGSGKTNICMMAADELAQKGSKTIYVDTEGGFSIERLQQVSKNFEKAMQKIIFLKPVDFKEQHKIINELGDNLVSAIGLVIIDTISMLYRLEIGKTNAVYEINKMLGKQIMTCSRLARKYKIPVLITNQIYSDVERNGKNKFVGGDLLRYGSKCLIELIKPEEGASGERIAFLRKHRSIEEDKKVKFRITEKGMF